eukprot:scaffold289397_cov30-Tisochrysis_lutea.AAC.7
MATAARTSMTSTSICRSTPKSLNSIDHGNSVALNSSTRVPKHPRNSRRTQPKKRAAALSLTRRSTSTKAPPARRAAQGGYIGPKGPHGNLYTGARITLGKQAGLPQPHCSRGRRQEVGSEPCKRDRIGLSKCSMPSVSVNENSDCGATHSVGIVLRVIALTRRGVDDQQCWSGSKRAIECATRREERRHADQQHLR